MFSHYSSHRPAIVVASILLASVVWILIWMVVADQYYQSVSISNVGYIGGGQICTRGLYDRNGNSQESFVWGQLNVDDPNRYVGPAPLYSFLPEQINPNTDSFCDYPENISPTLAIQGEQVYPVLLTISVGKPNLQTGESISIIAKSALMDGFPDEMPPDSAIGIVPITQSETINVSFRLDALGFDFSPTNDDSLTKQLGFGTPVIQSWLLAPQEAQRGMHLLGVGLEQIDQGLVVGASFELHVEDTSVLNPALVATISAMLAFLLSTFTLIKLIPEAVNPLVKQVQRKKKKRPAGFRTPDQN